MTTSGSFGESINVRSVIPAHAFAMNAEGFTAQMVSVSPSLCQVVDIHFWVDVSIQLTIPVVTIAVPIVMPLGFRIRVVLAFTIDFTMALTVDVSRFVRVGVM